MGETTREDEQRLQLERLIGSKYEILRRIGGGGMAQVLLARHRGHGGLVAIKILADAFSQDSRLVSRFRQEAATAASLSGHPNIVTIYDIGEGNGLHYLIMQFVCGEDMCSYLHREGPLAPPDAAGVIAQAAEGLVWAESKRVVHRDLKPSNLQLDRAGRIHILDFGISKIADFADGLTRPGESLGTPFYMSPEQTRGEGCDSRSDLYSLGVIFFELLTGRRPFENESVTAVQMAHLATEPPSLLDFSPHLPAMCDVIIQKLMKKDRNERYQSPRGFLDDLYRYGASSGPTNLRPQVDPDLQAVIDRPLNSLRLEVVDPELLNSHSQTPQAAGGGLASGTNTLPVEPSKESAVKNSRRSPTLTIALTSLILILIATSGWVYYRRSKTLEATVTDSHGTMVLVSAGKFIFGEDANDSPHKKQVIDLPDFYVDQTEVSNSEYLRFIQATHRVFAGQAYANDHPDEPVTNVSEADASAFAAWAGKRLPTEQEWEKAARGTDGRLYPWGDGPWTDNVPQQLQPVNSFPDRKSPFGVLNMAGNAWEWTATPYVPDDRELADMRNVLKSDAFSRSWFSLKGGSFSPKGDFFFQLYLSRGFPEDQLSKWAGFRCAKNARVTQ